MRVSPPLVAGRLVRRYTRFLADVETPDGVLTVHCPNTGAMTGCTSPGLEVWYSTSDNPRRKYRHTLEVVCTPAGRVGINSARANDLVAEALAAGRIAELQDAGEVRREARIPAAGGRFDFLLSAPGAACWVEVKSMTLWLGQGRGAFPDAVSERAVRHVAALLERRRAGERAVLLFCVQHTGIEAAAAEGVEVLAYGCDIDRGGLALSAPLPVRL